MDQNRQRNQDVPNRASNMEQAEGSRDNIRNRQGGSGGSSGSDRSGNSGGISNRPLDREECEQEQLPERGRSQSER